MRRRSYSWGGQPVKRRVFKRRLARYRRMWRRCLVHVSGCVCCFPGQPELRRESLDSLRELLARASSGVR